MHVLVFPDAPPKDNVLGTEKKTVPHKMTSDELETEYPYQLSSYFKTYPRCFRESVPFEFRIYIEWFLGLSLS